MCVLNSIYSRSLNIPFSLTPLSVSLLHARWRWPRVHVGPRQGGTGLLSEPPTPHLPPNTASLDLCVSFIFFALVYTKKTNNQKHKARIIKLSAGTSPSPPHPGAGGGGGFETGRGRESPSPHTRGVSQEHFSGVSQGGCGWDWVGRGRL